MGFTKQQLEEFRDTTVPDLIGPDCRLLFVGINPGLWTAATQTHFCHPSNRFYPALGMAGLINFDIDAGIGMTQDQRDRFTGRGMGITNLVGRATVRASELTRTELARGGENLQALVEQILPRVVAVAGVTAYRTAFDKPGAQVGPLGTDNGSEWWVLPNPSGLNAHITVGGLSDWFRQVGEIGGVL